MIGDFEDDWCQETRDYRMGIAIIYHGSKTRRAPVYGYKFVNTQERIMPKVGSKHFSYTAKGKKEASAYAKKVQKPVKSKKKY